jgi:Kef-type K+ transport system membrane component KefB
MRAGRLRGDAKRGGTPGDSRIAETGRSPVIDLFLKGPLPLIGVILVLGACLGDAAERVRVPWITGCIAAGLVLGPAAVNLLQEPDLAVLDGFAQTSLAVIAFNIGSQLTVGRLSSIGRSVAWLAAAQLLTPLILVFVAEMLTGLALQTALIIAAVAPATAPTTTFAVIRRRQASGPFVDRALGVLAINDAAAVVIFSVVSAAAIALADAATSDAIVRASLSAAAWNEVLSAVAGIAVGVAYLAVRRVIEDGRPDWEARLTALLIGLLLLGVGGAITIGLSHLLVPLSMGLVVANGADEAERQRVQRLIEGVEEPLFIIFFVVAGAHLPLSLTQHLFIGVAALVYLVARFAGKYGAIFVTASALGLDAPTRRYLGLCFPSQGALAMGLVLALNGSPAVRQLPPAAAGSVNDAMSVILVGVLLSQILGPVLIDFAVRRGSDQSVPNGG